jgi:hypothetical protein
MDPMHVSGVVNDKGKEPRHKLHVTFEGVGEGTGAFDNARASGETFVCTAKGQPAVKNSKASWGFSTWTGPVQ